MITTPSSPELTSMLYESQRRFYNTYSRDPSLTGVIMTHLVGRVIAIGVTLLLHAEAVCRVAAVCFVAIYECFSRTDEALLKMHTIKCKEAFQGSITSFVSLFYRDILESPEPELQQAPWAEPLVAAPPAEAVLVYHPVAQDLPADEPPAEVAAVHDLAAQDPLPELPVDEPPAEVAAVHDLAAQDPPAEPLVDEPPAEAIPDHPAIPFPLHSLWRVRRTTSGPLHFLALPPHAIDPASQTPPLTPPALLPVARRDPIDIAVQPNIVFPEWQGPPVDPQHIACDEPRVPDTFDPHLLTSEAPTPEERCPGGGAPSPFAPSRSFSLTWTRPIAPAPERSLVQSFVEGARNPPPDGLAPLELADESSATLPAVPPGASEPPSSRQETTRLPFDDWEPIRRGWASGSPPNSLT